MSKHHQVTITLVRCCMQSQNYWISMGYVSTHVTMGLSQVADPNEKPHLNGCGSYGFTFDTSDWPGVKSCCDKHDACYDTCLSEKETCDQQFKQCLKRVCNVLIESVAEQFEAETRNDSIGGRHNDRNTTNITNKANEEAANISISEFDKDVDKVRRTHTANDEAAKSCLPLARIMVVVVETIGCRAYRRGQRRVCTCAHVNGNGTNSMYVKKENVTFN